MCCARQTPRFPARGKDYIQAGGIRCCRRRSPAAVSRRGAAQDLPRYHASAIAVWRPPNERNTRRVRIRGHRQAERRRRILFTWSQQVPAVAIPDHVACEFTVGFQLEDGAATAVAELDRLVHRVLRHRAIRRENSCRRHRCCRSPSSDQTPRLHCPMSPVTDAAARCWRFPLMSPSPAALDRMPGFPFRHKSASACLARTERSR